MDLHLKLQEVAIKRIKIRRHIAHYIMLRNEVHVMTKLSHPCLMHVTDVFEGMEEVLSVQLSCGEPTYRSCAVDLGLFLNKHVKL